jgi:hypothetical protein
LIGRSCDAFIEQWEKDASSVVKAKEIVFFSPPFPLSRMPKALVDSVKIKVIYGEFLALLLGENTNKSDLIQIAPGMELYISGWLNVMLDKE